jgi:chromosome partitioning protein
MYQVYGLGGVAGLPSAGMTALTVEREPGGIAAALRPQQGLPPKIVVAGGGKGGSGKSTTAMGLSATSAHLGFRTLLVDADRLQHTAHILWHAMKHRPRPYSCITEDDPLELKHFRDPAKLRELGGHAPEIVIVDTPGSLAEGGVLDQSLRWADLVVVPSDMSPYAIPATVDTAEFLAARGARCQVLLNRLTPGERTARELGARDYLAGYRSKSEAFPNGIPVFRSWIRAYKAHEYAGQYGVPITWYAGPGDAQARADLMAVFTEMAALLGIGGNL